MEVEYPDESLLLQTGVCYHIGGCDKTGHPLIIFPSEAHQALSDLPAQDIKTLLHYFCLITAVKQRLNGFSYVINLQKASQAVITKTVQALHQLQSESSKSVAALYVIKPKSSKNAKLLEKLTGVRESKKNPVKKTFQVYMVKDFASLHRSIDKATLPEEFGGHLRINIFAWVEFRKRVDSLTMDVSRCQRSLEDVKDQMQIMGEYELPSSREDTSITVETINTKYNDIVSNLKLEHVIDKCSSVLDELNSPQMKFAQGDMLRDLVLFIRASQKELTDTREQLQLQWRQAQARLVQASQLREHQKRANKIMKWITRHGDPAIEKLKVSIKNKTGATELKTLARQLTEDWQSVQQEGDYILTDVEFMALQDVSEFKDSLVAIEKMKADTESFILSLAESSNHINIAEAVLINVNKGFDWYSRVLSAMPKNLDAKNWSMDCKCNIGDFLETAPTDDDLTQLSDNLKVIEDSSFQQKAAILIKRIRLLLSMVNSDNDVLSQLTVTSWRENVRYGLNALGENDRRSHLSSSSSRRSLNSTPKLRKPLKQQLNDSSTDDRETPKLRSRRSLPRQSSSSNTPKGKGSTKEMYIDLSKSTESLNLPQTLAHVDMQAFLQHEPKDTPASVKSKRNSKKKFVKSSEDDETDDTCPITPVPTHRSSARTPIVQPNLPYLPEKTEIPPAPQITDLPYNPTIHRQQLDDIITSSTPSAEEKLDMMAALLESGNEKCFEVKLKQPLYQSESDGSPQYDDRPTRLSARNLSRDLNADVTYSEHIYHWLKKQDETMDKSVEDPEPCDTGSVHGCIKRAEGILQEDIPNFTSYDQDYVNRFDSISKSGDSGITELTARDTLMSYNTRRTVSKESGMDSDITADDNHRHIQRDVRPKGIRPMGVPPLYLKKKSRRGEPSLAEASPGITSGADEHC